MYRIVKRRMEMEVSTNICVSVLCVELEDMLSCTSLLHFTCRCVWIVL